MNCVGIIQARFNSSRLPGKVLKELHGGTLLECVISRVTASSALDQIIVATSVESSDDPIAELCEARRIQYYRGSLENVVARFTTLLKQMPCTFFARICADSPFYDPALIDQGIALMHGGNYDIVTNVLKRSFPRGQSIEIVKSESFLKNVSEITAPDDLEHVTSFFYKNKEKFKIHNFEAPLKDYSHISMCIDAAEDLTRIQKMIAQLERPLKDYGWKELVDLYG